MNLKVVLPAAFLAFAALLPFGGSAPSQPLWEHLLTEDELAALVEERRQDAATWDDVLRDTCFWDGRNWMTNGTVYGFEITPHPGLVACGVKGPELEVVSVARSGTADHYVLVTGLDIYNQEIKAAKIFLGPSDHNDNAWIVQWQQQQACRVQENADGTWQYLIPYPVDRGTASRSLILAGNQEWLVTFEQSNPGALAFDIHAVTLGPALVLSEARLPCPPLERVIANDVPYPFGHALP